MFVFGDIVEGNYSVCRRIVGVDCRCGKFDLKWLVIFGLEDFFVGFFDWYVGGMYWIVFFGIEGFVLV